MTSLSWSVCWGAVTAGGSSRSLVSKSDRFSAGHLYISEMSLNDDVVASTSPQ